MATVVGRFGTEGRKLPFRLNASTLEMLPPGYGPSPFAISLPPPVVRRLVGHFDTPLLNKTQDLGHVDPILLMLAR